MLPRAVAPAACESYAGDAQEGDGFYFAVDRGDVSEPEFDFQPDVVRNDETRCGCLFDQRGGKPF